MDIRYKTNNSELKIGLQITKQKTTNNRYEPKVTLEDKVYLDTYYNHQPWSVAVDKTPTKIKARELHITTWMLTKNQQLMKFNLRIDAKPHMVKISAQLETSKMLEMEHLLKEFKYVRAWTYKDLKGIPPKLT